jgi:hypothetical protein
MTASYPAALVTKPSGIAVNNPIPFSNVDGAWDEIIALEGVLRGSTTLAATGANVLLKSGATGAIPLQVQGFAGQTADLLQLGSSAAVTDRLIVTAAGVLRTVPTGTSAGLAVGGSTTSNVFGSGTDVALRPGTDGTAGIKLANATGTTFASIDTTNLRVSVGDTTVASATLHLNAGSSPTTAAFGILFGTDTNLYRSAASTVKTDGSVSIGASLVFNDVSVSRTAADVLGFASGDGIKLTLGALELSGDAATATIKVTKSSTSFLSQNWYVTTLIGAESTNRFAITAGGALSWTEGAGSPVTLSLTSGNTGLDLNKNLTLATGTTLQAPTFKAVTQYGFTTAASLSLTGASLDFKVGGGNKTRIGLQRATDGAFRYISIDASDQIVIETS